MRIQHMRVVFLFGAGASTFGGACYPEEPPLGQGGALLSALCRYSPVWAVLPVELKNALAEDFERGMVLMQAAYESLLIPTLHHMGLFFLRFRPRPGHNYH